MDQVQPEHFPEVGTLMCFQRSKYSNNLWVKNSFFAFLEPKSSKGFGATKSDLKMDSNISHHFQKEPQAASFRPARCTKERSSPSTPPGVRHRQTADCPLRRRGMHFTPREKDRMKNSSHINMWGVLIPKVYTYC